MNKPSVHTVRVEFGNCDPAGSVFFPNLWRWRVPVAAHWCEDQGSHVHTQ